MGHGLGSTVGNCVVDPLATIVTLTDYTANHCQVGRKKRKEPSIWRRYWRVEAGEARRNESSQLVDRFPILLTN